MAIAKTIEITAESPEGYEDAVQRGIAEAARTIHNIESAWVKDHEIRVKDGKAESHRVRIRVTFLVESTVRA